MPRARTSEVPQRQSPRGPSQLRTSSSDSDPLHHRPITDRSPKLGRSPRGAQSDPIQQKKLGTRIAVLESQLGQAQDELKNLKDQLASAEAAKKEAQEKLEKKAKKPIVRSSVEGREKKPSKEIQESLTKENAIADKVPEENPQETDVFEVPVEKALTEPKTYISDLDDHEETELKSVHSPSKLLEDMEPEKASFEELALKNEEVKSLVAKLENKEKELQLSLHESEDLKKRLSEATTEISSAKSKEEKMALKLIQVGEELDTSKTNAARLNENLAAVEGAKEALETEMKKLRVQTEQWRKAADAAAAILAGDVDMNGRRISERCGSMDKHFGGIFETPAGGYASFVGSPGLGDDMDDGLGSGKRKGSGIRMFGDLWKKKNQK